MTGAVYGRTPNLGLGLLEFNFPNWGDDANENTKIIDAGFSVIGVAIKGAWDNNTPYVRGDLVIDVILNSIWRCNIDHTSAAAGTFEADRTAHPTYWTDASSALHARGLYTTATTYYANDVTYDTANKYAWAMATRQFLSTTWAADVASGALVVIVDNTQAVTDANAAKTAAQNSATAAAGSASGANTSATNAANSATASQTSATNSASSATAAQGYATNALTYSNNASTFATNAQNSATAAANSAAQAQAIYNSMYPDAPSNGTSYGRLNGAWAAVAPLNAPVFTGDARASTPIVGDNDTSIATTAFVATALSTIVGGAIIGDNAPSSPKPGQLWYESDSGNTFIWYDDGNTQQWVQVNSTTSAASGQVGEVAWFARSTPPPGFLKADGAAVSRSTYSSLFAAIGLVFGAGDGSTTFNVPDLRGEFIRGFDDGRGIDTGRAFGDWQDHMFLDHLHGVSGGLSGGSGSLVRASSSSLTPATFNTTTSAAIQGPGNRGTETHPRNVALLACIRYLATVEGLANAPTGVIVETLITAPSYTWNKPAGLKFLEVECVGPGGGGAHAPPTGAGQYSVGGGGGAGGYGVKVFAAVDLPASVVITNGTVGNGGAPGGNSSFGALATVNGGAVGAQSALVTGTASATGLGGLGGISSGWTINGTGAPGSISIANLTSGNQSMTAAGGSSPFGGGGVGSFALGRQAGANATGYGAGGGGANNNPAQGTSSLGGNGSPGFFRLKEIY